MARSFGEGILQRCVDSSLLLNFVLTRTKALVQHPPMGRRKLLHKDKQRGRNELIADCIEELTGEGRSRKQVSSHIQVLKPFVENDPQIMKWLSKDDMCAQLGRGLSHSSSYGVGRQMSNYPVTALPQPVRSAMSTYSRLDAYALQSVKQSLDVFEPTDFQMFVQRKFRNAKGEDDVERLHEYTKSVNNSLAPDLPMSDWQTVNRDFPLLAEMCSQRTIDCNVLIAEASIAFPQETWKDKDGSPLPGVELGISFLCISHHLPPTPKDKSCQVVCNNSFYENGQRIKDYDAAAEVRLEPSSHVPGVETQIKFGSTFWARTLGRLATKLLDTSKDHREDVTSPLRAINALQEVFVLTDHGPERILVIHWSFRQSTSTCGRASWRKLLLPSAQTSHYDAIVQPERADSMFESYPSYGDPSISQSTQAQPQPALQSPFEYDNSSGSALSSATWPTSISEGSFVDHQPQVSSSFAENNFDFNAGNINIAYDTTFNFADFDSSAFTFDAVTADFAADPALQDYSQEWCDNHTTAFDTQHAIGDTNHFTAGLGIDGHEQTYDNTYSAHYDQGSYVGAHDQQAFGGAGQDILREEDALAALADASYIASTM